MLHQLRLVVASSHAILDVAPQDQVRRLLVERAGPRYVGLDLSPGRTVDVLGDVGRLPFAEDTFDLLVCYHVLEHVPDDRAAIRELARVLRPGGIALLQVPHRSGQPTDEDPSAPEEERLRRFGQEDHVRYYGCDFEDRLLDNGLQPWRFRPRDLVSERELGRMALMASETVWLCRPSARERAPADWAVALGPRDVPTHARQPTWRHAGARRVRRTVGRSVLGPPLRRARSWVRARTPRDRRVEFGRS